MPRRARTANVLSQKGGKRSTATQVLFVNDRRRRLLATHWGLQTTAIKTALQISLATGDIMRSEARRARTITRQPKNFDHAKENRSELQS